jgi:hypothetical protein
MCVQEKFKTLCFLPAFSSSSSSNPKKQNPYHLQLQPNITKGGDNVRKSEKLDGETAP